MFTKTQKKQLIYLERMLLKEQRLGVGFVTTYTVTCKECKARESTHCVEVAERFINNHEGHSTWVSNGAFEDGLKFVKGGSK